MAVAIQHINGGATMPSNLNPNIPSGLEQIIMKGMALEIQDRYVSATEMLQDMEEFRKNPAILFQYRTIVDDATRPITVMGNQGKPRTTAEKVVQAKTGQAPSDSMRLRTTSDHLWVRQNGAHQAAAKKKADSTASRSRDAAEAARRAQQRRAAEERQREEDQRSRVATVAIVVCSAVAIFAIVVFLVALFNGVLLNKELEYVKVPSLVGEVYSDYLAQQLDDFNIQLRPQEYDDNYSKGVIMSQEPVGGTEVKKGADIWVTISMGPEPEVKTMDNFVRFRPEEVISALEGQGFKPLFSEEPSADVPEGLIIRTDPVAGTELTEGQAIKIYVSSGPDIVTAEMMDVLGKEKTHAEELLDAKGFKNVSTKTVPSNEPEGTVVYQSEKAGEEIDVTTKIILEVSEGPGETEEAATTPPAANPVPEETKKPESWSKKSISFALPSRDTGYTVTIMRDGVPIVSASVEPGTDIFTVPDVEGSGTSVFELVIDGAVYSSRTETF